MSEYPIQCSECSKPMGYVHATDYSSNYLCDECNQKEKRRIGCGRIIEETGSECGDLFEGYRACCKNCSQSEPNQNTQQIKKDKDDSSNVSLSGDTKQLQGKAKKFEHMPISVDNQSAETLNHDKAKLEVKDEREYIKVK